jgi:hypothetical protein
MPDRLKQVVSGEPSLETPHKHYYLAVNAVDPGAAGWSAAINLTEYPVGTTQVYVTMRIKDSAVGKYVQVGGDDSSTLRPYIRQYIQVNATYIERSGWVKLDSNKRIYWYASASTLIEVNVWVEEYSL